MDASKTRGDAIDAILVGAGHNIRLLLAWLRRFLSFQPGALKARMSKFQCLRTLIAELNPLENRLFLPKVTIPYEPMLA